MGLTRRALVGGAVAVPFVARAQAQGVVKIVVPFPPGGSVDAIARLVQQGLQQRLGATIIIENKSGASGSIGAAQVAKSRPTARPGCSCSTPMRSTPRCSRACRSTARRISTRCC